MASIFADGPRDLWTSPLLFTVPIYGTALSYFFFLKASKGGEGGVCMRPVVKDEDWGYEIKVM